MSDTGAGEDVYECDLDGTNDASSYTSGLGGIVHLGSSVGLHARISGTTIRFGNADESTIWATITTT